MASGPWHPAPLGLRDHGPRLAESTGDATIGAGRERLELRFEPGWVPLLWLGALLFSAMTLFALALPWLDPDDPQTQGVLPYAYVSFFGALAAFSMFYARWTPRYRFVIGPSGFHEDPRHAAGTEIAWSRVAVVQPRVYRQCLQLRGSLGELLGTLVYQVADVTGAFEAVLARVPAPKVDLPATFSWRTPLPFLLLVGGTSACMVGYAVRMWIVEDGPAWLVVAGLFPGLALLGAVSSLRRTRIDAEGLVCWRGVWRSEIAWRDVTRVALAARAGSNGAKQMDVGVEMVGARVKYILPVNGDLLGVLHAARAAHERFVARARLDQPTSSSTARRGSA